MSKISNLKFNVFYDGVSIEKYIDRVDGVTTNTSYIAAAGITDYNAFIKQSLEAAKGKPISFQVTSTQHSVMEEQARYICGLGDNVYVKIPIVLPDGTSTASLIKKLSADGLKINATCIHTFEQIDIAIAALNKNVPSIVSVFAGGISDTGTYPADHMYYALDQMKHNHHMQLLWAGCQHVLHVIEAADVGCHIITVPDGIMNKLGRTDVSIKDTSVNKSALFFADGTKLKLNI